MIFKNKNRTFSLCLTTPTAGHGVILPGGGQAGWRSVALARCVPACVCVHPECDPICPVSHRASAGFPFGFFGVLAQACGFPEGFAFGHLALFDGDALGDVVDFTIHNNGDIAASVPACESVAAINCPRMSCTASEASSSAAHSS